MEWRKIKRDSEGVKRFSLDAMYVQLPIVVRADDGCVIMITKDNWIAMKEHLNLYPRYTHYLPVPEINRNI